MPISYRNDAKKISVTLNENNIDAMWVSYNEEQSALYVRFKTPQSDGTNEIPVAFGNERDIVDAHNDLDRQYKVAKDSRSRFKNHQVNLQ